MSSTFTYKPELDSDVSNWFDLVDDFYYLNDREEQMRAFICENVEAYLNGVYDDPNTYVPMTLENWKNYIWEGIEIELNNSDNETLRGIYFGGREVFDELTEFFIQNYSDVQCAVDYNC